MYMSHQPELLLGRSLRQARELAQLSQTEAAQKLRITPAALSQYESGKRRIEALMLDRLAHLYGVPVTYFFDDNNHQNPLPHWETHLRRMAQDLSPEAKAGITQLIQIIHQLEQLYQITHTPLPVNGDRPLHHPFPPLSQSQYSNDQIAQYAQKVRRHFNLGMAPLHYLKTFLETQGYPVFSVPLGGGNNSLTGLFLCHPTLGAILVINEKQSYTRFPFLLSHEIAHCFFHWDRYAVLCPLNSNDPQEQFADRFASYFLIPPEGLQELLDTMGIKTVKYPEEVIHIARYFGVSYGDTLHRLGGDRKLGVSKEHFKGVKPVALATSLGYSYLPNSFEIRPLPPEERLPRIFLELSHKALNQNLLSLRRVAEILGISDLELEDRLNEESLEVPEEIYA